MGGCGVDDGFNEVTTVVLVGRTGNGISATGNSIIGKEVFDSMPRLDGVTTTCEQHSIVLENGQILNVIDTPGLFDSSVEPERVGKEIAKCSNLAHCGIHAFLVVISLRNRFSREDVAAIESLRRFFGCEIDDYMIVVFSGGDTIGNESLDDYLDDDDCPEPLAKTLEMCGNRCVLFDNMTEDEVKKSEQLKELLSHVKAVVDNNGGKPYSNELFIELKKGNFHLSYVCEFEEKLQKSYEEQLKQFHEVESKLRNTTLNLEKQLAGERAARLNLEKQLAEERAARLNAEAMAKAGQKKSDDKIRKLTTHLERVQRENDKLRKRQNYQAQETELSSIM